MDVCLLALGVRGTESDGLNALAVFDEPFWLAAPAGHPLVGIGDRSHDWIVSGGLEWFALVLHRNLKSKGTSRCDRLQGRP